MHMLNWQRYKDNDAELPESVRQEIRRVSFDAECRALNERHGGHCELPAGHDGPHMRTGAYWATVEAVWPNEHEADRWDNAVKDGWITERLRNKALNWNPCGEPKQIMRPGGGTWRCSRKLSHGGQHVAVADRRVYDVWPNMGAANRWDDAVTGAEVTSKLRDKYDSRPGSDDCIARHVSGCSCMRKTGHSGQHVALIGFFVADVWPVERIGTSVHEWGLAEQQPAPADSWDDAAVGRKITQRLWDTVQPNSIDWCRTHPPENSFYVCSREPEHSGQHVAANAELGVVSVWTNERVTVNSWADAREGVYIASELVPSLRPKYRTCRVYLGRGCTCSREPFHAGQHVAVSGITGKVFAVQQRRLAQRLHNAAVESLYSWATQTNEWWNRRRSGDLQRCGVQWYSNPGVASMETLRCNRVKGHDGQHVFLNDNNVVVHTSDKLPTEQPEAPADPAPDPKATANAALDRVRDVLAELATATVSAEYRQRRARQGLDALDHARTMYATAILEARQQADAPKYDYWHDNDSVRIRWFFRCPVGKEGPVEKFSNGAVAQGWAHTTYQTRKTRSRHYVSGHDGIHSDGLDGER